MLGDTTDRLGLDVNESGYMIGWIMECQGLGDDGYNDIIDNALTELEEYMRVAVMTIYQDMLPK